MASLRISPFFKPVCLRLLGTALFLGHTFAQTGATSTPQQAPKTAPQVQKVLPSYEGQNVSSVELAGRPDLNTQDILPVLPQGAGEPFSQAKVDASIAALQSTGKFQSIELEVRPEAAGVRVLFVLHPAIFFGIYEFPGASRFAYSRLLQVADYPPRGAFTPVDIENARSALEKFFQRNGYFQAQVQAKVEVDKEHGLANVSFNTVLGRRAKFGNVNIRGTSPAETRHLEQVVKSLKARMRGAAIRRGKTYSLKTLENASQYLQTSLMKQEHLEAEVKLSGAEYNANTNRADITFDVKPGPLVHVKVEGAHLWPWTRRKLLPLYLQVGINPEIIQEGRQNLVSYFQSKGYFDTKVTAKVASQSSGENVLYEVTKGPRRKVSELSIAGNQHLASKELLSHVPVKEGHFLSRGKFSEKLVRASVNNLKRVYQAEGFSDVQITPQVTERGGNLVLVLRVNEGTQDIVQDLKIEGNNSIPDSQLSPAGLKLTPGQAFSQKRVDDDRNQIIANYLRLGYLNASFRETAAPVNKDKHRLEVIYHITEGPGVRIASVITLGRKVTRQSLVDREASLWPEQPLRQNELLASESRLYNLGIFDWTEIDPRRQITTQTEEDAVIKLHEGKRNSLTYGFGFEVVNRGGSVPSGTVAVPGLPPVGLPSSFKTSEKTFWGPRFLFDYTRKNLFGKAQSMSFTGLAARLDQRAAFTYTNPYFYGSHWESNITVRGEHDTTNPIFSSRLAEYGFQLQRPINRDKTQNLFVRYSYRQTGLTQLLIPDLVPVQDRHVRFSTLSGTYIRDTRDNVLDAHKGIYESVQLDLNPKALGSSVNFARVLAQAAYYRKIPASIIWANSLRIGVEQPFAGSHVPLSEKFFSGGGSTIRGFPLNGAGPQRNITVCGDPRNIATCAPIRVPVGGSQLLIVNSELRIPVPIKQGLGIAAFYDGGNVYDRIGFHNFIANYTNTVGIGLRYATPVGPVRIDIGHNLNSITGIKSTQIFITLGQAF